MEWLKKRFESFLDNTIFAAIITGGAVVWSILSKLPAPIIFVIGLAVFSLILFILKISRGILSRKPKDAQETKVQLTTNQPIILDGFEFYAHRESMAWFKDEISKAKEVWCFWIAGGTAKQNDVLGIRTITRLILADPDEDNPAVDQIVTRMPDGATTEEIRDMIRQLAKIANERKIPTRFWNGFPCDLMVFANPMRDDAWVLLDIVLPHLSADQRPQIRIWKFRFPQLYNNLLSVYNEIWDNSKGDITKPTVHKADYQT